MRRPFVLAAAALLAGSLLAACGGGSDDHAMGHGDNSSVAKGAREVAVTGTSFQFEPAEIRARAGEKLAIVLSAPDILHDLTIDELDTHVSAAAGKSARGGLVAGRAGQYRYYCTVPGHREVGMEGVLIVE